MFSAVFLFEFLKELRMGGKIVIVLYRGTAGLTFGQMPRRVAVSLGLPAGKRIHNHSATQ